MTAGGIVKFMKFCCAASGDAGKPAKSSKSSLPVLGIGVGGGLVLNLDLDALSGVGTGTEAGSEAGGGVVVVGGTTFRGIGIRGAAVAGGGGGTTVCGIGLNTDGL